MKAVVFFSGVGGYCTGIERAGFKVAMALDNQPDIVEIWEANHSGLGLVDDIRNGVSDIKADLYHFSPPCQMYSEANAERPKVNPEGPQITEAMLRNVRVNMPRFVTLENVPAYQSSREFNQFMTGLDKLGYFHNVYMLRAFDCGNPQSRRRLVVIAQLNKRVVGEIPRSLLTWDMLEFTQGHEFYHINQSKRIVKRGKSVNTLTVAACVGNKRGKLFPRNPFFLQEAKGSPMHKPTLAEIGHIQGFPLDYDWGDSLYARVGIGNAVPVQMAETIGRFIKSQD